MMKRLIAFLLFLIAFGANAQSKTVYGIVRDADGHPVPGTKYYLKSNPKNAKKTNEDGEFSISFKLNEYDSLMFENIAFEKTGELLGKKIHRKASKRDSIYIIVTLPDKTFNPVYISPPSPDTVVGFENYSIADFEFMPSGNLLLLTYDKKLEKSAVLRLLSPNMEELDINYMGDNVVELRKDFRGNVHCVAEERVYWIKEKNNALYSYLENRDYFFRYVAPIIDTIGTKLYYSNYSEIYPAFDYMEFDTKDSAFQVMLKIEDELIMELYRSEFKYVDVRTKLWAHEKQMETGIDKEIWVGATVFTNSVYYTPLYAPLFKVNENELLVFDHYKNYMFRYHHEEGFTDSIRISYHLNDRKSGWEQPLIQDQINGKVYALFLKGGYSYLSEIDQTTGQVLKSFKLYYKYVEQIQIINDEVFYIYRPFESPQKKFLYREKLVVS